MNPIEFLELAKRLAAINGHAEWRTAVSRAYYAAFHVALQYVEATGVRFPESSEAHKKLGYCLHHSQRMELTWAATALQNLRQLRNVADYDLSADAFRSANEVASAIGDAAQIMQWLHDVPVPETRDAIRTYAKTILKLVVQH